MIDGAISKDFLTYSENLDYDFERVIVVIKKAVVSSVDFAGIGFAAILPDPGSSNPLFDPAQKDYVDNNQDGTPEQRHPLLYAAGGIPVVNATFKMPAGSTGQYLVQGIQGIGADQFVFEGMGSINNGTLAVSGMQAKTAPGAALPKTVGNQIRKYDDFAITWTLTSTSVGSAPISGGTSRNTLYVSAAQSFSPNPFESVVHLAIASSLGGSAASPQLIIDAIWSAFSDREVRRIDGNLLFYYGNPATSEPEDNLVTSTEGLLQSGNGECGSWVQFFLDCLAVNGVAGGLHVRVEATNGLEEMLVKNYEFVGAGRSGVSAYPFLYRSRLENSDNGTVITPSDVVDLDGIEGQGTDRPISNFQNHQLALIGGRYYDPSYGVSYGSLAEMEAQSIAGFVLAYPRNVLILEAVDGDVDGLADQNIYSGRAFLAREEDVTRADLEVAYAFPYPLLPSTEMFARGGSSSNAVESRASSTASKVEPEGDSVRGDTSSNGGIKDFIYAAVTSFMSERMDLSARKDNPKVVVDLLEEVPVRSVTRPYSEAAWASVRPIHWENDGDASTLDTVFCELEERWAVEPFFCKSLLSRVAT